MIDGFLSGDYGAGPVNLWSVVLGLLLAFLFGQTIAWVYMATHNGLSYSRAFVVSLILIPVIVAMVMMLLANNLVTAFGLMAVFAIVRFRNILRDTLDTVYVLAVIVLGMACGMQRFATAVLGCVVVASILGYVWFSSFGTRHRYDLVLHLRWVRPVVDMADLRHLLDRHSRVVVCANERVTPGVSGTEISFRLRLRDPARSADLLRELEALGGAEDVSSATVGDESEV